MIRARQHHRQTDGRFT